MLHNIPFMALMSAPRPANRPMATRLSEQAIVAIMSAFVAAYLTQWISNDRQEGLIHNLTESMHEVKIELGKVRDVERDVAVNKAKITAIERRNDTLDERRNNAKDRTTR